MTALENKFLSALKALDNGKSFIPLHEPVFEGNENKYVKECIDTGWVSSVGSYVDLFEKKLAEYLGVKRVIVTVNGTSALHLCLVAAGVVRTDEVLVPALTFVATANAVAYTGATPHFCDSSEDNLGICPIKLDEYLGNIADFDSEGRCINKTTGKIIRAIIPMHCFGLAVDMDNLLKVAKKYNITVIEDAAEALGAKYKNRQLGSFGEMSAFSFNGNKIITTGGGGAIATNDEELGARLKHLSTTAKRSKDGFFFHDEVGYNYRMPNINAALGCAQLERLEEYIVIKRNIAEYYKSLFADIEEIGFISESVESRSNYWLCSIKVKKTDELNSLIEASNKAGIMTRPLWDLMHNLPMFINCPRADLSRAEKLNKQVISLPSSVNLKFKM